MIEKNTRENLAGQTELSDIVQVQTSMPEGYDTNGDLINPDANREIDQSDSDIPQEALARLSELKAEINIISEETRGVIISAALKIGKRLLEVRQLLPAGRFGAWIQANLDYSERKAQDMMRLYEEYGRTDMLPEAIARLDYSKAVALLSAPAEDRAQLAEQADAEGLSVRQLQAEIKRLNVEKVKGQMKIDEMEGRIAGQCEEIARLDERERTYDQAIVERDQQLKRQAVELEKAREDARIAQAKAASAEASAEQLRRMRSEAEDRASASVQRATDVVNRANQTARDLAEARAKIAALEQAAAAAPPTPERVEVVPEAVQQEMERLKAELSEAKTRAAAPPAPQQPAHATAVEKFKWFYSNQMQPTFSTALNLLREVARENGMAAGMYATAMTKACQQLMAQLGDAK